MQSGWLSLIVRGKQMSVLWVTIKLMCLWTVKADCPFYLYICSAHRSLGMEKTPKSGVIESQLSKVFSKKNSLQTQPFVLGESSICFPGFPCVSWLWSPLKGSVMLNAYTTLIWHLRVMLKQPYAIDWLYFWILSHTSFRILLHTSYTIDKSLLLWPFLCLA